MKHLLLILGFSISLLASGQINVLPYNQPFDNTEIPEFWTQTDHLGNGQTWQFGTDISTGQTWSPSPVLNGNYAILNSDGYGEGQQQNVDLISPTFDLTGYSNVNLRFTHFFYDWLTSYATLSYSIDNGTSWTEITIWEESSSNPEIFNRVIPEVAGQSEVKFKWNYVGEYGWGWAVDDISVSEVGAILWVGSINRDWNEPNNWFPNILPAANIEVYIQETSNNPVILSNPLAECYQLIIVYGANLTINPGLSLSVYGNLINNNENGLIIKSDENGTGSLIAGSITGDGSAQIERYMTQNQWHNIGSPVNQTITSFLENNSVIPTKDVVSRGMMDYNTSLDNWNTFFTNEKAGSIGGGKGFTFRTSSDTHVTFNGPITSSAIDVPLSTEGNRWNHVGNPYTSAIKLNYLSGTNNFLGINSEVLEPNYVAIYVWDGTGYQIINDASGPEIAAFGQGFFVKSDVGGGNISFKPEMQVHRPTIELKAGKVNIPEIKLEASTSEKTSSTVIKFLSKGTKGLDKGYDAGTFKADPTFSIFTRLVNDNNVNFGLQCLPELSDEIMIIPVGIDFFEGGEVTFTSQMINIPEKSSIILEDRLLNKTIDFKNAESQYTTTVAANSMVTGRFYLHVSGNSQITGINKSFENKINAWTERDEIVITGISESNAIAKLYDIRGSSVMIRNLVKTGANRIKTDGIPTGIYMLQVIENGKRTGVKLQITGK